MSFSMSMGMGTSISMSINHQNIDKLLPFTSYLANYLHGAHTASDVPPMGVETQASSTKGVPSRPLKPEMVLVLVGIQYPIIGLCQKI